MHYRIEQSRSSYLGEIGLGSRVFYYIFAFRFTACKSLSGLIKKPVEIACKELIVFVK
jgi:hypothetical protein